MYFKLTVNNATIRYEAKSEKDGKAKALKEIESIRKSEGIDKSYGALRLYCYGPGEREVWAGEMQYSGKPTHEQMHEVSLDAITQYRGVVKDQLGTMETRYTKYYLTYKEAHDAAEKLCKRTMGDRGTLDVEVIEVDNMKMKIDGGKRFDLEGDGIFIAYSVEFEGNTATFTGELEKDDSNNIPAFLQVIAVVDLTEENILDAGWDDVTLILD